MHYQIYWFTIETGWFSGVLTTSYACAIDKIAVHLAKF